jgi:LPXTG-site transpeptidase (sortase) family protein
MKGRLLRIVGSVMLTASILVTGIFSFEMIRSSDITVTANASAREIATEAVGPSTQIFLPNRENTPISLPGGLAEVPSVPSAIQAPMVGEPFGLVYIPRLHSKAWAQPLLHGIDDQQLNAGIGHFPLSAMPGQIGNFAIAGHRATHGEPFAYVDQLEPGDEVIIRTNSGWFVYVLKKDRIVKPEDVWVVDPVPGKPSAAPTQALLTIVTCEPRLGSSSRWIWWGELLEVLPVDQPPDAIDRLGSSPI